MPLLLVSAVWLAANGWWIATYRRGQILDIDEAGYLGMARVDHYAALRDGLEGWLAAVWAPGIQAPLVPALTSAQFFVTGTHAVTAFAVPLLAGLATVLLTYGLADRLGGPRLAWPALLLVATAPGVIIESRAYHFGAPAMAVATAALYCLVRSDRLARPGFALAFGAALGLMPLTRTMTIAFAPGLVLAAVLQAAAGPDRRRRLIHLAAALAVAVAVAATWLIPNGRYVFGYLTEFGYGRQSTEYGDAAGVLNPDAWLARLWTFVGEQYLPHTLILCLGLAAAAAVAVRRGWTEGPVPFLRLAARSPVTPVAIVVALDLAALVSSRTNGNGYTLPVLPAMAVLTVWGLGHLLRRALPAGIAGVGLIAVVPLVSLDAPARDYLGYGVSAAAAREWIAASDWGARQIIDRGPAGITAFGFRDRLFNVNTVQLAVLEKRRHGAPLTEIKPVRTGNTLADYRRWLGTSTPCLLFTASGTAGEFPPPVDPRAMAIAAETSGFAPAATHPLPNGRILTLWQHGRPGCR